MNTKLEVLILIRDENGNELVEVDRDIESALQLNDINFQDLVDEARKREEEIIRGVNEF